MAYRDEVLADSPVGYWRLGEASGTVANDETANNRDGTYINTPTLGVAGPGTLTDTAITIVRANSERVEIPDAADWSITSHAGNAFTVEFWVKWVDYPDNNTERQYVISKESGEWAFMCFEQSLGNQPCFIVWDTGFADIARAAWDMAGPTEGTWYHIVAGYDGAAAFLYVNGTASTAITHPGSMANYTQNANQLVIGARNDSGLQTLEGSVDEVAIYGHVLSPTRIQAHYDAAFAEPGVTVNATASNIDVAGKPATLADPITFVGVGSRRTGYGTTVGVPSGVQADDLLLTAIVVAGNQTVTPPVGWTQLVTHSTASAAFPELRFYVFWRIADGLEGTSESFTISNDEWYAAQMAAYRSDTGFFHKDQSAVHQGISPFSITPTTDPALVFYTHWNSSSNGTTPTVPSGLTNRNRTSVGISATEYIGSILADLEQTTASQVTVTPGNDDASLRNVAAMAAFTVGGSSSPTVGATVANVNVTGVDPIGVAGSTEPKASVTNIDITAQPANAELPGGVIADTANITITAHDIEFNEWQQVVLGNDPVRWYRMDDDLAALDDYFEVQQISNLAGAPTSVPGVSGVPGLGLKNGAYEFPVVNTSSVTYEAWVRTTADGIIFGADVNDYTKTTGFTTLTITEYTGEKAILVYNNKLSRYEDTEFVDNKFLSIGPDIADGSWHHIMLVKKTVDSTTSYKTFIDGVEYTPGLNFEFLLDGSMTRRAAFGRATDAGIAVDNADMEFDELIIYNSALTVEDAADHTTVGRGGTSVQPVSTVTNITVEGVDPPGYVSVDVQKAGISLRSHMPSVQVNGGLIIGAHTTEIDVAGPAPQLVVNRDQFEETIPTNISVTAKEAFVSIAADTLKFIAASDTSLTAIDAQPINELDFGALLYVETKELAFKLGNLGDAPKDMIVSITSNNQTLRDNFTVSTDDVNYYNSVTVRNIGPNEVSDPIWVRIDSQIDRPAVATVLINVEQRNA